MNDWAYLILAHCLLDYPLQGEFMARAKRDYALILLAHCLIWGLGVAAVLAHLGRYEPWMAGWLVGGHWAMDWLKCHHLGHWCRVAVEGVTGRCTMSEGVCAQLRGYDGHDHAPWAGDPLGMPLWIDQAFHILQIAVCVYFQWGA